MRRYLPERSTPGANARWLAFAQPKSRSCYPTTYPVGQTGFDFSGLGFRFHQYRSRRRCSFRQGRDSEQVLGDGGVCQVPGGRLLRRGAGVCRPLTFEFCPDGICRFPDAAPRDKFPSHGSQQIVVSVHRVNSLTWELTLHHECDEHLPPHEAEAGPLRCLVIDQELHTNIEALTNTPPSARGLSEGVKRVSGLVEVDRWELYHRLIQPLRAQRLPHGSVFDEKRDGGKGCGAGSLSKGLSQSGEFSRRIEVQHLTNQHRAERSTKAAAAV